MMIDAPLRQLIESGPLAHLVTLEPDGRPQVSIVWIGLDGDTIVSGHMNLSRKLRYVQRDPRVCISLEAPHQPGMFLAEHAVLNGRAEVVEGPHTHLSGAVSTETLVRLALDGGDCINPGTLVASDPPCSGDQRPAADTQT